MHSLAHATGDSRVNTHTHTSALHTECAQFLLLSGDWRGRTSGRLRTLSRVASARRRRRRPRGARHPRGPIKNGHELSPRDLVVRKAHIAGNQRPECVVAPHADIQSWMHLGSTLPYYDVARKHEFVAKLEGGERERESSSGKPSQHRSAQHIALRPARPIRTLFTPSRWPGESRLFLVVPPLFFVAKRLPTSSARARG